MILSKVIIVSILLIVAYTITHIQKQSKNRDIPTKLGSNIATIHGNESRLHNQKYMTCDSLIDSHGLSYVCTKLYLGDDPSLTAIPSGLLTNITLVGYERECFGRGCALIHKICDFECACCLPYIGIDPQFVVKLWAPDSLTQLYTDKLNCTLPPFHPTPKGVYLFTCNFTGYGFASVTKPLQFQLMAKNYLYPKYFEAFITAGLEI